MTDQPVPMPEPCRLDGNLLAECYLASRGRNKRVCIFANTIQSHEPCEALLAWLPSAIAWQRSPRPEART